MAAPSGTTWGAVSGSSNKQGRIGLYIKLENSNTETDVTIEVWFWSRVSVDDSNNDFYFDNGKSSATTNRGSVSVKTTSNSSWNTANQVKIKTYTYSYTRGTSVSTKTCAAKLTGIEWATGTMTVSKSYTIPALASYKITYNANGGSGAPGQQTKYYGKTLKLSTTKPTRTGYTFQGWGTSATGSVVYDPGGNYTANAADTLYAIWKANTWTVKYDANGGTGAPGDQTKTYGVTLKLSTTMPTLTNYNFLGWGTSPDSTTVAYQAGADYTNNAAITLYAIWELAYVKPKIINMTVDRCTSSGALSDEGTYALVKFHWFTEKSATGCIIQITGPTISGSISTSVSISGTSGSVSRVVGSGSLSAEYSYDVEVVVRDSSGENSYGISLPAMTFILDFLHGGNGLAIGKPATNDGFEIAWNTLFEKNVEFSVNSQLKAAAAAFLEFQSNGRPTVLNNIGLAKNVWLQGQLAPGSFTNILRMNANGEVELNWTNGGLKGRVFKKLWEGTLSVGGKVTISEAEYYNLFIFLSSAGVTPIPVWRRYPGAAAARGTNGYPTANGNQEFYSVSVGFSGTSMTLENAVQLNHYNGDTHAASKKLTITNIYGVI